VHLAGNDYSGSHYGILLHVMSGLTLNGAGGTGLDSTGIPVALDDVSNSLIENLDVSCGGPEHVDNGVQEDGNSLNNTISNVRSDSPFLATYATLFRSVHLAGNDYSGSHYGLLLHVMSGLTLNGPGGTGLNSTFVPVALDGVSNSLIEN